MKSLRHPRGVTATRPSRTRSVSTAGVFGGLAQLQQHRSPTVAEFGQHTGVGTESTGELDDHFVGGQSVGLQRDQPVTASR
jgi:hypothetical protein